MPDWIGLKQIFLRRAIHFLAKLLTSLTPITVHYQCISKFKLGDEVWRSCTCSID